MSPQRQHGPCDVDVYSLGRFANTGAGLGLDKSMIGVIEPRGEANKKEAGLLYLALGLEQDDDGAVGTACCCVSHVCVRRRSEDVV